MAEVPLAQLQQELRARDLVEPGRVIDLSPTGQKRSLYLLRRREIRDNGENYRQRLPDIPGLAASILQHGLLENLVAIELPEWERSAENEQWVELKAGSRRLAAIDFLIERGKWHPDQPIPTLLLETDGFWENLTENVQRLDAEPWEIGRRLSEAASGGLHNKEIAARIGKSPGYVSRFIAIGTGIAPETIVYLREQRLKLPLLRLQQLASIKGRFGDPDGPAQIKAIQRYKMRGPRKRREVKTNVHAFAQRLEHMRSEMPVPRLIRPIVEAIINYLELGARPNFKHLHAELLGERVRVFGDEPEAETP